MDVSRPYAAIVDGLEGDVLRVLSGTRQPMTGREVQRRAHRGSQRGIQLALGRLTQQGIVTARSAPPAILYVLNREHIAAPIAMELAALRTVLLDRLRTQIGAWRIAPAHASLFGSAARGDGGTESDIDLLIVRPAAVAADDEPWASQLEALALGVEAWTGNRAAIAEMSTDDLAPRTPAPPIFDELRADAITLSGPDIAELLGAAA